MIELLDARCGRGASPWWRRGLANVASLRFDEWRVLAEAVVTLMVVRLALPMVGFPKLLAWATRPSPDAGAEWSRERVERTAWVVGLCGRLARVRCLTRSLALARVLARRGVATDIRIGVLTVDGKLLAHAWVEWRGRALNDDNRRLQGFAAFDRALGTIWHA